MPPEEGATKSTEEEGRSTRRATQPRPRAALRYEAALLEMLRHPGVTQLISVTDADGVTELSTRSGSDRSLADLDASDLDTAAIAGVVAALATTCADLHALGVVHGRLEPQRVAIPPSGQPVLTGFGAAGPNGTQRREAEPPLPPFCDPAAMRGAPLQPPTDVFGLGALLEHLLERHPSTTSDPVRHARRRLRRLARSATAEAPERRPEAVAFAAAILEAAPAARLPGETDPPASAELDDAATRLQRPRLAPEGRHVSSRVPPAGIGVAAALVALGALVVLFVLGRDRAVPESGSATDPSLTALVPAATPMAPPRATDEPDRPPTAAASATTAPPATIPHSPDTNRPEVEATTPDTAMVVFDGVRYRIGGGERRWAVGDWDCDGDVTLATLDPSSGALTFFHSWPESETAQAAATDHLAGAVDLRAEAVAGCHELRIVRSDRIDTYEGTAGSR